MSNKLYKVEAYPPFIFNIFADSEEEARKTALKKALAPNSEDIERRKDSGDAMRYLYDYTTYTALLDVSEDDKRFLCVWGEGYAVETEEVVNGSFFCEERGYNNTDIEEIFNLSVGEFCKNLECGYHLIVRLPDFSKELK